MTDKKTRTPRNYEAIAAGAMSLPLQERVDLKKALEQSIEQEKNDLKAAYEKAQAIINDKN